MVAGMLLSAARMSCRRDATRALPENANARDGVKLMSNAAKYHR